MTAPLRVILATRNAGKAREFDRLLGPALNVEALPSETPLPAETGDSFAANARVKAESVAGALRWTVAVLADDSGLEVAALGGRPGVMSARFAADDATDEQNLEKLLKELGDARDRKARFVCRLCLALPEQKLLEVEGLLEGEVTLCPLGDDGFGYDPVFRPRGWSSTLAEASPEDKDAVSHRGAASRALLRRLVDLGLVEGGPAGHGS